MSVIVNTLHNGCCVPNFKLSLRKWKKEIKTAKELIIKIKNSL